MHICPIIDIIPDFIMKNTLSFLLLLLSRLCMAQQYESEKVTYLNEDGKHTKEKDAVIIEQRLKLDDTLWEFNTYTPNGPRIKSLQSRDENGKTWNGRYATYDRKGNIQASGNYKMGNKEGTWYIYTPADRILKEQFYVDGKIVWQKDSTRMNAERDSTAKNDSIARDGKPLVEVEAAFPGGERGWAQYLNVNMKYPDKAIRNNIKGSVIVLFVVDTTGHIPLEQVLLERSVEYSMDKEALQIILSSPAWTPATREGKPLKVYKKQPFVFTF